MEDEEEEPEKKTPTAAATSLSPNETAPEDARRLLQRQNHNHMIRDLISFECLLGLSFGMKKNNSISSPLMWKTSNLEIDQSLLGCYFISLNILFTFCQFTPLGNIQLIFSSWSSGQKYQIEQLPQAHLLLCRQHPGPGEVRRDRRRGGRGSLRRRLSADGGHGCSGGGGCRGRGAAGGAPSAPTTTQQPSSPSSKFLCHLQFFSRKEASLYILHQDCKQRSFSM